MNHTNGSIPCMINGNQLNDVELKCLPNGYHGNVAEDHHIKNGDVTNECKKNGELPLVENGVPKEINCSNGNISKLKFDFESTILLPFDLLHGEHAEQKTCGKEAWVMLTNFRLFICQHKTFYNIPLRSIEYVEMRELSGLHVHCKDGKVTRIGFDSSEDCSDWWRYITSSEATQTRVDELFAFSFFNVLQAKGIKPQLSIDGDCEASMYVNEIKRMGFNTKKIWRTTELNSKFEICKTYPKFHIVPACVSDEDLKRVAQFRSLGRFPSVIWRNQRNGAVLVRSSQPEVGWFGWRCDVDEKMLPAIARAAVMDNNSENVSMAASVNNYIPTTSSQLPFLVIDARSYAAAVANRAKGGGCECQEYYSNCDIKFMGLPNIHAIRKSFQSIRALCLLGLEQNNWYSALEATKWLQYLSGLIKSALIIVEAIDIDAQSTLVHCSDGWDRTPQLVSLTQLLLDPYYRTIKGFRVLIEREWLEFGHKFADRCGHSSERDMNERCPVFFQWLDTVNQIMRQFPSAFEFNESFLVKLASHVYSCLYGTFLCNSICERHKLKIKESTISIWTLLLSGRKDFVNFLYTKTEKVLYPNHHIRCLQLWEKMFLNKSNLTDSSTNEICEFTRSLELTDSGNSTMSSDLYYRKICKETRKNSKDYLNKPNYSSCSSGNSNSISLYGPLGDNFQSSNDINREKRSGLQNTTSFINASNTDQISEINICKDNFNEDTQSIVSSNESVETKSCTNFILNSLSSSANDMSNGHSTEKLTNLVNSNGSKTLNEDDKTLENSSLEYLQKSSDPMTDSVHTLIGDQIEDGIGDSLSADTIPNKSPPHQSKSINIPTKKRDNSQIHTLEHCDRQKSFDDLCISLKSNNTPPTEIGISLSSRNNSMRRAHSSPDSPTLNRLQRTKSVPDVMAISCINTNDLSKQYSSVLETNQTDISKHEHIPQNISKYLDTDGLTIMHSFVDHRLHKLKNKHVNDITRLYKKYEMEKQARMALQQQCQQYSSLESCSPASFTDFIHDETVSLPDSICDRASISSISNDEGWEQVQYDDVQPTRWMPDHSSSTCLHCGSQFSLIQRKHHCRKCGGVFCDACSNYQISVPEEQLYNPVRVCIRCYDLSVQSQLKMDGAFQFDQS